VSSARGAGCANASYHRAGVPNEAAARGRFSDQVEKAAACADRAVALARRRGARGDEAWALRLLGDVALHRDRPEAATAAAHYGAAMTLASELEMRPLLAHCHSGLAGLYRRIGQPEQAEEHLAAARAMYGEMGMTHWLAKLENSGRPCN